MTAEFRNIREGKDVLSVLVIDDHALLAETVTSALMAEAQFHVHSCGDVDTGLDLIARNGPFDTILLDHDVPGMNAFEGLRLLNDANDGRVVLFSGVARRMDMIWIH